MIGKTPDKIIREENSFTVTYDFIHKSFFVKHPEGDIYQNGVKY